MKKKLSIINYQLSIILFLICTFALNTSRAQTVWNYDFGTTSASFNSPASTVSTSFFIGTPTNGGTYRARVGSALGGFNLAPSTMSTTGHELQIQASSSASAGKAGVSDWASPSTEGYVKFKIKTTSSGNGNINFSFGNNLAVTDVNGYTQQYSNALTSFTIAYTTGAISSVVRRANAANIAIASHGFTKDNVSIVEVYGFNGASGTKNYFRNGTTYTLDFKTWDMWVDGVRVVTNGATGNLLAGDVNLAGFAWFAESSTGNVAWAHIDDLEYSNALPTSTITCSVTPTSWDFGSRGKDFSYTKEFSVTTTNLTGNLTVSSTGAGFTKDITTIAQSATSTKLTATFSPTAATSYSGNIQISGGGITTQNISLAGTGKEMLPLELLKHSSTTVGTSGGYGYTNGTRYLGFKIPKDLLTEYAGYKITGVTFETGADGNTITECAFSMGTANSNYPITGVGNAKNTYTLTTPIALDINNDFYFSVKSVTTAASVVILYDDGTSTYDANASIRSNNGLSTDSWTSCSGSRNFCMYVTLEMPGSLNTITINETPQSFVYDGTVKAFEVVSTPQVSGFNVVYSPETPLAVGSYDVTISRPEDATYAAFSKTIMGGLLITTPPVTTTNVVGWSITAAGTSAPTITAHVSSLANVAVGLTTSMGTNITITNGTPGSMYIGGWDSGNGTKYWTTTAINTVGYNNLSIQNNSYGTATAPRDFKVQYKVGAGGTWTDIAGATYTLTTTTAPKGPWSLPSECENQSSILIRWVMTSNMSIGGVNDVAAGGNSRMAEVYLKGVYTAPSEPTISVNPTTYNFGNKTINANYTHDFTVNTTNLTGDLTVAIVGAGFSVDKNSIPQSATTTTLTVTFNPTLVQSYNAVLNITGGGITNPAVGISGAGVAVPVGFDNHETYNTITTLGANATYNTTELTETGSTGNSWAWLHCQDGAKQTTPYTIDGVTPVLRHPDAYFKATITGGISGFSLDYKRAYTGTTAVRIVEVYINDVLVGSGEDCKGDANLRTLIVSNLTISGSFTVRFKLQGTGTANAQTCIDNFKWDGYGSVNQVATPTFTPIAGTYTEAQNVTLNCATEGATIHYTTDSSDPTGLSAIYTTPIPASSTTTIKAIAVKSGMENSIVATALYTINLTTTISVDPTSYNFGNKTINANYTHDITVNTANLTGDLTVAIVGAGFSVDKNTILQNAATTTLTVTFNPMAVQDYSAVLNITGGGITNPAVNLSGAGILAPIEPVNIVQWTPVTCPGGSGDFGPSPFDPATKNANLDVVGLTRHFSVLATGSGAANAWGSNNFVGTDMSAAITGNYFFSFQVKAKTGYRLSLNSIDKYNVRRSASGPNAGQWQYSIDGTNFINIGTAIASWGAGTAAAGNEQPFIDLSSISELQNVSSSTNVTIRLVLWGATGTGGTFYINGNSAATTKTFDIIGIVEAAAPPTKVATPTFNPVEGTYTEAQNVTLNCATEGATIHYTTDSSDPTDLSAIYTAAIPVNSTTTIKAIALKSGMENSIVATAIYTINLTPTISVNPTTYNFGNKTINANYTHDFVVNTANLTGDLTVAISGAGFSVDKNTIPQNATTTTLTVTFNPTLVQSYSAVLNITGGGITNPAVAISGAGVAVPVGVWQDFENAAWVGTGYASRSVTDDLGTWTAAAVGTMDANDRFSGTRSLRLRGNAGDACLVQMNFDKPNGLGKLTFKYASYSAHNGGQISAYYSTNQGGEWILIGTVDPPAWAGSLETANFDVNIAGNIRIKIARDGTLASSTSVNIDDIDVTDFIGTPTVATPTFTPFAGSYSETQNVTINCVTEGATIHYTTDSSDPSVLSAIYTTPIPVSATTTIKAIGIKSGLTNSDIATALYTINLTPTISVDPTSYNFGNKTINANYTHDITVNTANLTGDLTVSITGAGFSVDKNSIPQSATITTLTVTFNPTLVQSYSAVLNITGGGINNPAVAISGAGIAPLSIPPIVISGVYGGGGNSGAIYKNDYIELHNTTNAEINIEGYALYYASATGTSATAANTFTFPTGAKIGAHKFCLIKCAPGTGGVDWTISFDYDAVGAATDRMALAAGAGKVLLLNSYTELTVANSIPNTLTGIQAMANYVDYMPFGNTSVPVFGSATVVLTNTTAAKRKYTDVTQTIDYTFNVGVDFTIVTADADAPRNSNYGNTQLPITINETPQSFVYDGNAKAFLIIPVDPVDLLDGFNVVYSPLSPTNAGSYDVTITRPADANYLEFHKTIVGGLVITPAQIAKPTVTSGALTYNGNEQTPTIAINAAYEISNNVQTNAGSYNATVTLNANYEWTVAPINEVLSLAWSIGTASVEVIANAKSKTYNAVLPALDYTTLPVDLIAGNTFGGALATTATQTSDVGVYSITQGTLAIASGNYAITYESANLTITSAQIIKPTVTSGALTYNGTEQTPTIATNAGYSITGNSQTNSGSYNATVTLVSTNYEWTVAPVSEVLSLPWAIGASAITINGFNITKEYDGTVNVTNWGSLTFAGLIGGQTSTASTEGVVGSYNNAEVGTAKPVSFTGTFAMSGGTALAANYTVTQPTELTGSITAIGGTLTVDPIADVTYNGSAHTPVVVVKSGVTTLILNVDYTVAYSNNTNAGTANINVTGIGSYAAATGTGTFNILKASIVKPSVTSGALTYNGSAQSPTIATNAAYIITNNEQTNAGIYNATVTLISTTNYQWADATTVALSLPWSIETASITVTADAKTKVFGESDPPLTYSVAPVLFGADLLTGTLTRAAGENVGTYLITSSLSNANYNITFISANLTITPAQIVKPTITSDALTYNGSAQSPTIATNAAYTITNNSQTNAGSYNATVTLVSITNYQWADATTAALSLPWSIETASITVTADAKTKVFGESDPALTYSVAPVLFGADLLTGTLTRAAGENVGTYLITSSLANANYIITFISANLSISPAQIVKPTVTSGALTYNGSAQSPTIATNAAYTITNNSQTNAGSYNATVTLISTTNYQWTDATTDPLSLPWTIEKATPTYTTPTGLTAIVGQTLANVTLPTGFTWQDPTTTSVGAVGSNVFQVTFTPTDVVNYNVVTNINVTITVSNPLPSLSINPTSYNFGNKVIGQSYTHNFIVNTANLTGDLTVAIEGAGFSVDKNTILQNATTTTLTVTFNPTLVQGYNATLNITGGGITNPAVAISGAGVLGVWENFETITGAGAYAGATVTFGTGDWRVVGFTTMDANDRYNGTRSVRLRGNTGDTCNLRMLFDKPNGLGKLTFKYGSYSTHNGGQISAYYSINQGANWTLIGSVDPDTWANSGNTLSTASFDVNVAGNIRIKIARDGTVAGTSSVNIDDIDVTDFVGLPTVGTPTFNPVAGTYTEAQNVAINCATTDAIIYYTTDLSTPSTLSTVYTAAIPVNVTTTIKAIAVKVGMENSNVATAIYNIVLTPSISVNPTSYNFGNKTINANYTHDFVVNTANLTGDLTVAIVGAGFSVDKYTILQNATTTTLTVTFNPTLVQSYSAVLNITGGGITNPAVAISGAGIAPLAVPPIVISGVYGGGGNAGATYKNDYIELHNTTNAEINIAGYALYYASAAGTNATLNNSFTFPAGAKMGAHKFCLIKCAQGTGGVEWTVSFDFDASGGAGTYMGLAGASGKVLLLSTFADLSGSNTISTTLAGIQGMANYVDYMPFGNTAVPVFGSATIALTNTTAAKRKYTDATHTMQYTFNIGNDFDIVTADADAPRNSLYGAVQLPITINETPQSFVYDGSVKAFVILDATNGLNDFNVVYNPTNPTNVGSYDVTITRPADANYLAFNTTIVGGLIITKANITKPTVTSGALTYSGAAQSPTIATNANYTISGNSQTNAGSYNATVTLNNTTNYQWADGSITPLSLAWSIGTKTLTIAGFNISKEFDGNATVTNWGTLSFTGLVGSQTANVSFVSVVGTYNDATVGTNKPVSYTGTFAMTGGTAVATNYAITQPTGLTGTITTVGGLLTFDPINAVTYNGTAHSPTVVVKSGTTTLILNTDYTVSYSNNINAGTANVNATGIGTYAGATGSTTFIINPAQIAKPTVTSGALTYNGNAQSPTIATNAAYTITGNTHTNAASYNATVTLISITNYQWADGSTAPLSLPWTIGTASVTVTANAKTKVYNAALPVLDYVSVPASLISGNVFSGALATTATQTSNVGIYPITQGTLTIATGNYSITYVGANLTITKATPTYTTPTGLTAYVGQTLANVTLPTGFTWQDPTTTSVGAIGINTFQVTFTPTDIINYNIVTNINVTITVSEAPISAWEDFELIGNLAVYAGADVTLKSGLWRAVGYSQMDANDRYNGLKSMRLRGNANDSCNIRMLFDKPNGLGTLTFKYGSYSTHANGQISAYYSINQGANWILIESFNVPSWIAGGSVLLTKTMTVNVGGNVRIKIARDGTVAGTSSVNIDDIDVTDFGGTPTVATPTFNPVAGTYTAAQNVTINCATAGATIHYTTNGTTPTTASLVYSTAIPVNVTTTIKALAVKSGMDNSNVATALYTINLAPSISINPTSYNFGNKVIGASYTHDFTVTTANLTGNLTVAMAGAGYSVNPTTILQSATSTILTVTFSPTAVQVYPAVLNITGGGITNPAVAITGAGVEPSECAYLIDFEDDIWTGSAYTKRTVEYNGDPWIVSGVSVTTDINDRKIGLKSLRFRGGNAADQGDNLNRIEMGFDRDGIGTISFKYGSYSTHSGGILDIEYSTNGGANWILAGSTEAAPAWSTFLDGNFEINISGQVRARVSKRFVGSGSISINIDDICFGAFGGDPNTVATPSFSPPGGTLLAPTNITINCATVGATIRYTTNGTEPTETSAIYTAPINVSSNTTLKAKAWKAEMTTSATATATYNFPINVANIAAFKAANTVTNSTPYKITGNVTFVFRGGRNVYIQDATGGLLIYDHAAPMIITNYNNGDLISGGVIGTYTLYNGLVEMIPLANTAAGTAGTPVTPTVTTMANLLDNFVAFESKLVRINNVKFDAGTFGTGAAGNIPIHQNELSMFARNQYGNITGYVTDPDKTFDVIGFAIPFNTDRQIAPRNLDDIILIELDQVETPVFDPNGGTFYTPINFTLSCATEGASIYYTIDGGNPTTSDLLYSSPIQIIAGSHIYKAKAFKSGFDASEVATATFVFDVSVNENDIQNISIYPNPVNDEFRIKSEELRVKSLEVYDITGKQLLAINDERLTINVSELQAGIYFIKIETDRGVVYKKFVKN